MCSSARLSRSDAAPGRADRRRGPSAGSRWRCRAGPGSVAGVVFKWRTRDRSPRRKRRAALAARSGALRYPPIHGAEARGDPRRPVRPAMVGGQVGVRDVDGRGGCGGSPKTPAARYGHTGQPRKAPDGLRRDFTPDAAAGRALVPGSHRNPHRRRQTPSRRCWICIRGAQTDTRHWMAHCVQPTLSVECLRRSSARQSQNPVA